MKLKRILGLSAVALLLVATMAVTGHRVLAQGATPAATAAVQAQAPTADEADETEVTAANDTDNVDEQVGDQNAADTAEESDQGADPAPAGTPAITAEAAQQAALASQPGTVVKTELDDENGTLIYSVQLDNGTDVKVDAMSGIVLGMDSGQD